MACELEVLRRGQTLQIELTRPHALNRPGNGE